MIARKVGFWVVVSMMMAILTFSWVDHYEKWDDMRYLTYAHSGRKQSECETLLQQSPNTGEI